MDPVTLAVIAAGFAGSVISAGIKKEAQDKENQIARTRKLLEAGASSNDIIADAQRQANKLEQGASNAQLGGTLGNLADVTREGGEGASEFFFEASENAITEDFLNNKEAIQDEYVSSIFSAGLSAAGSVAKGIGEARVSDAQAGLRTQQLEVENLRLDNAKKEGSLLDARLQRVLDSK